MVKCARLLLIILVLITLFLWIWFRNLVWIEWDIFILVGLVFCKVRILWKWGRNALLNFRLGSIRTNCCMTLWTWKIVMYFLVDLGSMILGLCMIVSRMCLLLWKVVWIFSWFLSRMKRLVRGTWVLATKLNWKVMIRLEISMERRLVGH